MIRCVDNGEFQTIYDKIRFDHDADVIHLAAFKCFVSTGLRRLNGVRKEDIDNQIAFLDYLVSQYAEMCAMSQTELTKAELIISRTATLAAHIHTQVEPINELANLATKAILSRCSCQGSSGP